MRVLKASEKLLADTLAGDGANVAERLDNPHSCVIERVEKTGN